MIRRFLKVKAAYNVAVMQEKDTKQFFIEEEDVKYLQALDELLLKFHISTNWLLSSQSTIPLYNCLYDLITGFLSKNQAHPGLVLAGNAALEKLRKYYAKTDESDVYCVSTMIDPMLKFGYWREEELEDEIIVEQELKCRSAFSGFLKEKFKAISEVVATAATAATTTSAANKSAITSVATTAFENDDDEEGAVAMISKQTEKESRQWLVSNKSKHKSAKCLPRKYSSTDTN
ncbi:hypothetical protein BD408DRAFT_404362 [Parasitella parasitica]|nr:hypothetical protein BD408DRAFT_404362 [Parasitella parasitica]